MSTISLKEILEHYDVDERGNVLGKKRQLMKLRTNSKGYLRFTACVNNRMMECAVHRLVAFKYIPNQNNLPQVNHINGKRCDNRVENLEWCTNQQNSNNRRLRESKKKLKEKIRRNEQ